jgi:hypothetical protein
MMGWADLWRRRLSDLVERVPRLYRLILIARHRNSPFLRRIVSPGHDLVIEGFPRSANSFAVSAFMFANGWRDPRIATHAHSPAQVHLAARWGVPTILLIRRPEAAIIGWMAYTSQRGPRAGQGMSPALKLAWVRAQTLRYARFYERTTPLGQHFVLATFEEVTRDLGVVIARLNAKFGCDFAPFRHTPQTQARVFAFGRRHLSPDPARDALKAEFAALYHARGNEAPRRRAEAAYLAALVNACPRAGAGATTGQHGDARRRDLPAGGRQGIGPVERI